MSEKFVEIFKSGDLKVKEIHEFPDWHQVTEEMDPPCAW